MTVFLSFSLYFLSFTPLWIAVIFVDVMSLIEQNEAIRTEIISIICILAGTGICLLVLACTLKSKRKNGIQEYTLASAVEEKTITAEYLLSYILPLFAFDFTLWKEVVLFLIFFVTFGMLCIRHKNFTINIMLDVFNYRIYQCDFVNEDNICIERKVLYKGELNGQVAKTVEMRSINNDFGIVMPLNAK